VIHSFFVPAVLKGSLPGLTWSNLCNIKLVKQQQKVVVVMVVVLMVVVVVFVD